MTDIEKIVITAINLAKKFKHEYVAKDHLSTNIKGQWNEDPRKGPPYVMRS